MNIFSSHAKKYVRKPKSGWNPRTWASLIPFKHRGNYAEVFRALWENRDNLHYALRILNHGVCDGCALGTTGMKDWTIDGIHLCNVRLRLLRLNTMPKIDQDILRDVAPLKNMTSRQLRELGRMRVPWIRAKGDAGFQPINWYEVYSLIADIMRQTDPDRMYFYLTSRGIPNETYYAAQKAVRALGTNNIDNAARICHSPSTFGLKSALGVAATTCSYTDLIGTDLITFFGSNVSNNQPVMMKYLYHAKKAGTKIAVVNPYREPGMEAYWIPSDLESAMFGTKITDRFFQVRAGGDMAFLHGVCKIIIEKGWHDSSFVDSHTAGFDDLRAYLDSLTWEQIERASGLPQSEMLAYAEMIQSAEKAIFVWGMGITQHTTGEDNVHAIINLALLKGFVGREGCGLMPIRGHSGVQGGAEMGAYATVFPGGKDITSENAKQLSEQYGFDVPDKVGMTTPEMLDAAKEGRLDVLFTAGGNFREVMPDPEGIAETLAKIPLRIHMDISLSSQMLIDPADVVIILPAQTRYEIVGGVTQTSTERRVMYSPEIDGPRIEHAKSEWEVLCEIAARVRPALADKVLFPSTQAIRDEIAHIIPFYDGIQNLKVEGDAFQYGGDLLCKGWKFPTPDGKAHFKATTINTPNLADNEFIVVTRRGKQFNSMVQEDIDPANHQARDAIIISARDAKNLKLSNGDKVSLSNEFGSFQGHIAIADIAPQTIEIYWPEGNVLLNPTARSPLAKIPAYKSIIARLSSSSHTMATSSAMKVQAHDTSEQ